MLREGLPASTLLFRAKHNLDRVDCPFAFETFPCESNVSAGTGFLSLQRLQSLLRIFTDAVKAVKRTYQEITIHEVGLATNILTILEETAEQNSLSRIDRVVLEIGQFSGVNLEALKFAFEVVYQGTILQDTNFEYRTPPLLLYCRSCEEAYAADFEDTRCPVCLESNFTILKGQEMTVLTIEGV